MSGLSAPASDPSLSDREVKSIVELLNELNPLSPFAFAPRVGVGDLALLPGGVDSVSGGACAAPPTRGKSSLVVRAFLGHKFSVTEHNSVTKGAERCTWVGSDTPLVVSSVAYLKTASTLALDDDFAVQRAQFDLANVTASRICLFGDQGRTL